MNASKKWYRNPRALVATLLATAMLFGCAAQKDRPPLLTASADLRYPAEARERGIEGSVVVRYDITETGAVVNAQVVFADPPGVFDEAALVLVRSFQFQPGLVDGTPTYLPERTSTVTFKLEDDAYAGY